ncbi:HU family DNA-binding protein [Sinisalibacter aestuarii]|uniref:DNA-binding protein n=1 Tax=Sinisalibacter aestuarii TaxID=2949426 RepID=A0ABQ5LSA4_9RHOB|nr:HU family DNA-binding protein [Sinisalibacter aestuarii]GKY87871.1 hypothetical protein STA1M1_17400 [Sinisalibacter aestuarii]
MTTRKTSSRKAAPASARAKTSTSRKTTASAPPKASAKPASPKVSTRPAAASARPTSVAAAMAAPKPAAPAPEKAAPAVKGVSLTDVAQAGDPLKKKEFFERVKARSGDVKGRDVRLVLDAVLEELGTLLAEGEGLNAQPLGNLKVQKRRVTNGANVVVCKLRRKKAKIGGKDPLAEAAE